jgi:hypothetical protein
MQMEYTPLSALRVGCHNQCIRARASRVWLHRGGVGDGEVKEMRMVLIDDKVRNNYLRISYILSAG